MADSDLSIWTESHKMKHLNLHEILNHDVLETLVGWRCYVGNGTG